MAFLSIFLFLFLPVKTKALLFCFMKSMESGHTFVDHFEIHLLFTLFYQNALFNTSDIKVMDDPIIVNHKAAVTR